MNKSTVIFFILAMVGGVLSIPTQSPPTTVQPKENSVDAFVPVPHATYLSANSYVDNVPYGVAFNPETNPSTQLVDNGYFKGIMPSAKSTLDAVVWVIKNVGSLVLQSTIFMLVIQTISAVLCSFTSCDFQKLTSMNNDSLRAFMTPEKLSTAAALVQDAIGKYNRLQRDLRN